MKGKRAAAGLGLLIGAGLIVFMELIDVWLGDEGFFDTGRSWLLLVVFIAVFPFLMVRAYEKKQGIYADRDEPGMKEEPH